MKLFLLFLLLLSLTGCDRNPQSYLDRGIKFFDAGKYDDAGLQYQKALQKNPNLGEAHYRMGLLNIQKRMIVPAYLELQRSVELMPDNPAALALYAQLSLTLYESDRNHPARLIEQAAAVAQKLLSKDAASFDGNLISGALAKIQSRPDLAINYLRTAVAAKPHDLNAQLALAGALVLTSQASEGMELARQIIAVDKTYLGSYDFLILQYGIAKNLNEVEKVFRLKAANNPKLPALTTDLARFLFQIRNTVGMKATLQTLLDNRADFPQARLLVGTFYESVGLLDDSIAQFSSGLQEISSAKPSDPAPYRKNLFTIYSGQKKWNEAGQQIEAVLKANPGDSDARMMRALFWLEEGKQENLDRAIAEFRAQTPNHPQDPRLPFQIGTALARKGDADGARAEWNTASRLDPAYLPAHYSLAQSYLDQGRSDYALRNADQVLAITPNDPRAQMLRIGCLIGASQFSVAHGELNKLTTRYPNSSEVRYLAGTLANSEHNFKDAEIIFRTLAKPELNPATGPPARITAGLAQALTGENESGSAMQVLQAALVKNPGSITLRDMLARLAGASGNYDVVIEQYRQIIAATPHAATPQYSLAEAYSIKGDSVAAISILKKMADADPKNAAASLELAQTYAAASRPAEAKAVCRRILQSEPRNPGALNDLAWLMAEDGENLDQALTYAQQGLQYAAEPALKISVSDTLGWIYLKKKMYPEALQTFQSLVAGNPADPTYRYHLAATLYATGDRQKARSELQTALAAKPPLSEESKIKELLSRL